MDNTWLRVVAPFGDYSVGDTIKDAAVIERIKGSEQVTKVVQIVPPDFAQNAGGEG